MAQYVADHFSDPARPQILLASGTCASKFQATAIGLFHSGISLPLVNEKILSQ